MKKTKILLLLILVLCMACAFVACKDDPEDCEHIYNEGTVTKEPTCSAVGTRTFICEKCSQEKTEDIPKIAHNLGDWIMYKDPTFDEDGSERKLCSECDYFEERTVDMLSVKHIITVDDGCGNIVRVRVGEDLLYTIKEPVKIGYNFLGFKDTSGNDFATSGTVNKDVTITAKWELDDTDTLAELVERAAAGTDKIKITKDIVIDTTVYVTGETHIYSESGVVLKRAAGFGGDLFVIGEDKNGANTVLENGPARLTLGMTDGSALITIDGNSAAMTVDVVGSVFYLINSAYVDMYDGVSVIDHKKVGNERVFTHDEYFGSTINRVGGAGAMIVSGSFTMHGGIFDNVTVNAVNVGSSDYEDETYYVSSYGGAIYSVGNFNMYGGAIKNCYANRGGGVFANSNVNIYAGVFEGNYAENKGGAIASYGSQFCDINIGSENAEPGTVLFKNNVAKIQGGALLSYSFSPIIIAGGTRFEGNRASDSVGGAISTTGPVTAKNTEFINNYAFVSGGAIYQLYEIEKKLTHSVRLDNCLFEGNEAGRGGAILVSAENDATLSSKLVVADCLFKNNKAKMRDVETTNSETQEVSIVKSYGSGGAIYVTKASILTVDSSRFEGNTAEVYGGSLYLTTDTENTVTDTVFKNNVSDQQGGAVYINACKTAQFDSCEFTENGVYKDEAYYPERGGAIYVTTASIDLLNCEFGSNKAYYGGAVYLAGTSILVDGATGSDNANVFENNLAYRGGAICMHGTATLAYAEFSGNTSTNHGGAIYTNGTLALTKCVLDGNTATGNGGAIYADLNAQLSIKGIAAKGNGAVSGGAIYARCKLEILTGTDIENVFGGTAEGEGNTANEAAAIMVCGPEDTTDTVASISGTSFIGNETISSSGAAVYIKFATAEINNSVFKNNKSASNGGAMTTYYASVTVSQTSFEGNSATAGGGAIYVTRSAEDRVTKTLGCTFKNNTANNGGAIYVTGTGIYIDGDKDAENSSSTFESNTAVLGGAIYIFGNATVNGTAFKTNKAEAADSATEANGGAVYVGSGAIFTDNGSNYVANTAGRGGAIYLQKVSSDKNAKIVSIGASFDKNTAEYYGGAICAYNGADLSLTSITLTENSAKLNGGAIWTYYDSNTVIKGILAKGNSASQTGGVIYARGNLEIVSGTGIENIFGGTAEGEGNIANEAGAIMVYGPDDTTDATVSINGASYINNEALSASGAAVYIKYATGIINNSVFKGNKSANNGGAVSLLKADVTIKNSVFENNETVNGGGALYITQSVEGKANTTVNCTFKNNTANNGGALYVTGTGAYVDGDTSVENSGSVFESNTAVLGGAIYSNASVTLNGSGFTTNKAEIKNSETEANGGAIYSNGNLSISDSGFTSNTAITCGGAIYGKSGTLTVDASSFKSNSVTGTGNTVKGGAIFVAGATLTVTGGEFDGNFSGYYGGAIGAEGTSAVTISGGTVVKNSVGKTGSALYFKSTGKVTMDTVSVLDNKNATNGVIYVGHGPTGVSHVFTNLTASGNSANKGGVFYISGGTVKISDSQFSTNVATGAQGWGGAIFNINIAITVEDCEFIGNSAISGGAMYNNGDITLTDCSFKNNTANEAGAIMVCGAEDTTDLVASISGTSFTGNETISSSGAAVYIKYATAEIENSSFKDNKSANNGGALSTYYASVTVSQTSFEGNSATAGGGAIYVTRSAEDRVTKTLGCTFKNNTAVTGGAIYATDTGIYIDGDKSVENSGSVLEENTAEKGGAACSNNIMTFIGTLFKNNSAVNGGALYVMKSAEIFGAAFESNTVSSDNTDVKADGGAIYVKGEVVIEGCTFTANSAPNNGGAICADLGSSLRITGIIAKGNSAKNRGGVIYTRGSLLILTGEGVENVFGGTAEGEGNTAIEGAAIEVEGCAATETEAAVLIEAKISGAVFIGNTVTSGGAAIYFRYSDATLDGCTFKNNAAGGNGGAITTLQTKVTISETVFEGNTASAGGGAIYITQSVNGNTTATLGCTFKNNTANNGGAVYVTTTGAYVDGDASVENSGSKFEGNTATNGGAIFAYGDTTVSGSSFTSNTATTCGGAIYAKDIQLTVNKSTFKSNSASGTGTSVKGGAIFVTNVTLTVSGGEFDGNSSGYYGGAIGAEGTSSVTISGGTVVKNSIGSTGSALYFKSTGKVTMDTVSVLDNKNATNGVIYVGNGPTGVSHVFTNLTASGNSANKGGVFYISGGTVEISDSELTGNEATGAQGWGGAIYIGKNNALVLTGSTVKENTAMLGGGIYATKGVAYTLTETVVESNTAQTDGNDTYTAS